MEGLIFVNNRLEKKDVVWIKLMEFGKKMGCHQIPERSFFFKGYQFPVCGRCTGVIIGEIVTIILFFFRLIIPLYFSIFFMGIMGLDWFIQRINLIKSNNINRCITGFCRWSSELHMFIFI